MARIICFADNAAVVNAVQQGLGEGNHTIHLLSASQLTSSLRQTVQNIAPDIILLELSHATDNPHLYFFLRADNVTRNTPIILVSTAGKPLAQQAEILGADGYIERPLATEQLRRAVAPHLLRQHVAAA
jgi:two-component SAPR family response regulator